MTAEDQDILAKISQLAGQINRHKNQQQAGDTPSTSQEGSASQDPSSSCMPYASNSFDNRAIADSQADHPQASTGWRPHRGSYSARSRGYPRGGRIPQIHRNKTLVLNGNNTPSKDENMNGKDADAPTPPAWVTKTDRHLQLINPAIYEKQSQQRTKAMEETRKLKLKQRDERERVKLSKHLQRQGNASLTELQPSNMPASVSHYEITVQGIRFRVVKNGSKLMKIPGEDAPENRAISSGIISPVSSLQSSGDENAAKATPKTATVGGVRFYRSKNGNLYRSGIVKAQRYGPLKIQIWNYRLRNLNRTNIHVRRGGVVRKIDEPCKAFSTTGSSILSHCQEASIYESTGTCLKGPRCRYVHDPSKVAICKDFLQKGVCVVGDSCDLSHDLTPERTPACLHFAKGNCSKPNCRYSHVRVSADALVCRPFGTYGYCEKGANCTERHVHECPNFSNTGVCNTKGCKLPHKLKASIIRKNATRGDQPTEDGTSDLSSDEDEDEIDSDDVDSDDMDEEFFGDGSKDPDVSMQNDFIGI